MGLPSRMRRISTHGGINLALLALDNFLQFRSHLHPARKDNAIKPLSVMKGESYGGTEKIKPLDRAANVMARPNLC